jgi:hypothetical protein
MSPSMVHRHRDVQGGSARAAVFGASDGLVSNVALILGFAGASTDPSIVRLAGIVVADVAIGDLAVDAIAGGVAAQEHPVGQRESADGQWCEEWIGHRVPKTSVGAVRTHTNGVTASEMQGLSFSGQGKEA